MINQFFIAGEIKKITISEPKDPKKFASAVLLVQYGVQRETTGGAVEVVDRDAMALQACGCGFGAGDGAIEVHLVLGQRVDEAVGGGAGADADDALAVEARENVVDGGLGHGLFQLILVHRGRMPGKV